MVEVLTKYLKDVFDHDPRKPARIRAYRGGYLPTERRDAEKAMRDGRIDGIVSTSALELGVDPAMTVSCYQPDAEGRACGVCDACRIRKAGFEAAGTADSTRYAGT